VKVTRIIISSIMALLLCMPMCLCGYKVLEPTFELGHERSCCHHGNDEENEEEPHQCESCYDGQLYFSFKERDIDSPEQPLVEKCYWQQMLFDNSSESELRLVSFPPPDLVSEDPLWITLCVFRL